MKNVWKHTIREEKVYWKALHWIWIGHFATSLFNIFMLRRKCRAHLCSYITLTQTHTPQQQYSQVDISNLFGYCSSLKMLFMEKWFNAKSILRKQCIRVSYISFSYCYAFISEFFLGSHFHINGFFWVCSDIYLYSP